MSEGFCIAYTASPEAVKLSELRARTDQQLSKLIHSKLELGLTFVTLVKERPSEANPDHAEQVLRRAEQAVVEVKQLLPVLKQRSAARIRPDATKSDLLID